MIILIKSLFCIILKLKENSFFVIIVDWREFSIFLIKKILEYFET